MRVRPGVGRAGLRDEAVPGQLHQRQRRVPPVGRLPVQDRVHGQGTQSTPYCEYSQCEYPIEPDWARRQVPRLNTQEYLSVPRTTVSTQRIPIRERAGLRHAQVPEA